MAITDHPFTETGDTVQLGEIDGPIHIGDIVDAVLVDIEISQIYARDQLDIQFGDSDV